MPIMTQNSKIKLMCSGSQIAKMYCQNQVIYSSGNVVTYVVDTNVSYQEEVDEGESCLSSSTFTPTKDGWTFLGWRQNSDASVAVLDSLVMGDEPVTLYAVFRQDVTLSYTGNGGSGSTATQTGVRYYNNGAVTNPSFTLRTSGYSRSGYTFSKWALGSAGGTQYAAGDPVTLSASTTMYAIWTYTGAPFYIVRGMQCIQTLGWTFRKDLGFNNILDYTFDHSLKAGTTYPYVACDKEESDKNAYFYAESATIQTNGNRSLAIDVKCCANGSVDITVGGVKKSGSSNTFDISGKESVTITARIAAVGYEEGPFIQFINLRLY